MAAKKRKASSTGPPKKPASSKLTVNSFEDVADSEDEFLINRDKISLAEGREAKRRRKMREDGTALILQIHKSSPNIVTKSNS
jgi:U3 small nucleolar RNA-associated protein 3